jgi:hypothetical protein
MNPIGLRVSARTPARPLKSLPVLADAELGAGALRIERLLIPLGVLPRRQAQAVCGVDEVRETLGLFVDREGVELLEHLRAGLRQGGSGQLTGGLPAFKDHARIPGLEPGRLERAAVDLDAHEAKRLHPHRVVRRGGVELGERQHAGLVELADGPAGCGQYPSAGGELVCLGRVRRQGLAPTGDVVQPDGLGEAVVAVSQAVKMAVDQARQHAAPVKIYDLSRALRKRSDRPTSTRGDDRAVTNRHRRDRRSLVVDGRDLAVVEDQVRCGAGAIVPRARPGPARIRSRCDRHPRR